MEFAFFCFEQRCFRVLFGKDVNRVGSGEVQTQRNSSLRQQWRSPDSRLVHKTENHSLQNQNGPTPFFQKQEDIYFIFYPHCLNISKSNEFEVVRCSSTGEKKKKEKRQLKGSIRNQTVLHLCLLHTRPSSCAALHCLAFCYAAASCTSESKEHFHFPGWLFC